MASSEQFADHLGRVFAGGRSVVVAGNVGDLHVGPGRRIMGFEQLVATVAADTGRATIRWTPATGTTQLTPPGRIPVRVSGPGPTTEVERAVAELVAGACHLDQPAVILIDWSDWSLARPGEPPGVVGELLSHAATDPALQRAGHRLVIADRSGLTAETLGRLPGLHRIAVPLPDLEERIAFVGHFTYQHRSCEFATLDPDCTLEQIAEAANGMSLRSLLAVMGELRHDGRPLDVRALTPVKHDFLVHHTEGTLRPISSTRTFDDIAGLHNLRMLLGDHAATGGSVGHLLLAGPPGTGKSTVAGAIGRLLGLTIVALGDLRAEYVGASERRARLMIETVEAMSPAVVFIDEMDKTLGGGDGPSGDSGVTQRLNGMIWEWTGEVSQRRGVLVVGATNHPELLGPQVHSRFTAVPVLHPDPTEALAIVRIAAARAGRSLDLDGAAAVLASRRSPLSGRALAEIVAVAARHEDVAGGRRSDRIGAAAFRFAVDDLVPWGDQIDEELMTLQAIRHTRRRSLLPWNAARAQGVGYEVRQTLAPFITSDGNVDLGRLDARITQLRATRGR